MRLHVNHGTHDDGTSCDCGCDKFKGNTLAAKMMVNETHHSQFMGRDFLVVPVIMAKSDVVMNGCLVPAEEMLPIAWNGVPVTVRHPQTDVGHMSANTPDTLEEYAVGTIFNTKWVEGSLRAEAWVDVQRAEDVYPGLIAKLESGDAMDVSTGYFAEDEKKSGTMGGKTYSSVSRNINPDHLALLPDETGACSWDDGCGVRANEKDGSMADTKEDGEKVSVNAVTTILKALGFGDKVPDVKANGRGDNEDDYRLMIADLISSEESPFVPDDEQALRMLTMETLTEMRDRYAPSGDEVNANQEGGPDVAETKTNAAPLTAEAVSKMIADGVAEALKANAATPITLNADDRAALDQAKAIVAEKRATTIASIVANSDMKEEQLKDLPEATLTMIANGIKKPAALADYSGRAAPVVNAAEDDAGVAAMIPPDGDEFFVNVGKGRNKELN